MKTRRANSLTGSEWLKNSFSIWRDIGKDKDVKEHPAPFPVALVSKLIDCFVADRQGQLLDPFAGSGSSLVAALQSGMDTIGFDINPEYKKIFENRLSLFEVNISNWKYEIQDARNIEDFLSADSIEICITSPPYWNILNRKRTVDRKDSRSYSENEYDLGNLEYYEEFLDSLGQVITQVGKVLRPHRYFILNVMDIRKGSKFYPLHQDASEIVLKSGPFSLEDIIIWDRQSDYNSMRTLGYPCKFIINKVHEYLLIFKKRD